MKKFKKQLMSAMTVLAFSATMVSCNGLVDAVLGTDSATNKPQTVAGIPSDASATPNPTLPQAANTTIPNINYSTSTQSGQTVIRFDMSGISDPNSTSEWLRLYGTSASNQNIWVSIDNKSKGIKVTNTIDSQNQVSKVDLVFLVDNSGSMDEEADAVANGIMDWSTKLSKTLDMRFGCVGYDGKISGAIDFTLVDDFKAYLNKDGRTGTSRTYHFANDNLKNIAVNYSPDPNTWRECGVKALRLADEQFNFRSGANRVYVNFTDEPNQPNYDEKWSVEYVKNPSNWPSTKGTIHTVFSDEWYENYNWTPLYEECPWLLSDYTGGTVKKTSSSFAGVTLDDLPITGALQNSYIIQVSNVESLFDGQSHTVKITVLSPNGTVRAEKEFTMVFTK